MNKNIKVIEGRLIFDEYSIENYRNYPQNKYSYIVMHDDGDEEYIDCLLLNINILNYIDVFYNRNDFYINYLKKFNLFYYNGFLGVEYNINPTCHENQIYNFFNKYGNYFLEDLKNRVIELYNEITKEIKIRYILGELFHNK